MSEMAFLICLAVGLVAFLSGVFWIRLHWRRDIGPYRESAWLDILRHPERFTATSAVGPARVLTMTGLVFLLVPRPRRGDLSACHRSGVVI
jgi:hypothetical protein